METSFGTTIIETKDNVVTILGSGRSCYEQELDYLYQQLVAVADLSGWNYSPQMARYPGWPAKMDSPIVSIVEKSYKLHSNHVKIGAIHAGLECGMITSLHPHIEAISIGPTVVAPHSPVEKCKIDTVGKCFEIILEIINNINKLNQ